MDAAAVSELLKKLTLLKPELQKLKGWDISLSDFGGASVFGVGRNLTFGYGASVQEINEQLKTILAADHQAEEAENKLK